MINYSDFPADSWNKTVDGSEVRKIIREEVRAEGKRIVKSLVKAINLQPAVNAIPIEWIEELAAKLKEDNFEKAMFLLDIRDVWEEESGAETN